MRTRPRRLSVTPRNKERAALGHCLTRAADRIGPIEILDGILEWIRGDGPWLPEGFPRRARDQVRPGEDRMRFPHLPPELAQCIEWKRLSNAARQSAQDLPVFARLTRRKHRPARQLPPTLGVDVSPVLLGVGGSRQDDIGAPRAAVAMMPLIDDKS